MVCRRWIKSCCAVALLINLCGVATAITLNEVDSFQGSADNWNNGVVVGSGGPAGDGDSFLELSSGSMGLKPRLITLNQMQWTGDFVAAGVGSLTMELKNFGSSALPMRVTIRDVAGNSSVPGYSSTNPFMLPADGQWHLAEFSLTAADMTAVNPSGGTLDPFSYMLMNVAEFRILSSTVPAVVGDVIDAQVGIDEITALPPPPASIWTGASSMNWGDGGNWTGPVPGATSGATNTDTASFSQNATNTTLVVDAGRNVQNITFDTANVNPLVIGTAAGPSVLLTAGGTIQTTSTAANAQTINAPLVLGGDYTFNGSAANPSARLLFGGGITPSATSGTTTLTLAGSNTGANTIAGILADDGAGSLAVVKNGTGLWMLSGANQYSGGTTVLAGTLRFDVTSGTPTIAAGATATVDTGATLELAGSVSALSSGANRVNITNSSDAPGILVSGRHQQIGGLEGSGMTQVNAGGDLTANHIIQGALVIGGAAGNPGLVTVDASDATGNPLLGLALPSAPTPEVTEGAAIYLSGSTGRLASSDLAAATLAPLKSSAGTGLGEVPEPSTLCLLFIGVLAAAHAALRRSRPIP
jgi:autotransporter-associated beta strand protein